MRAISACQDSSIQPPITKILPIPLPVPVDELCAELAGGTAEGESKYASFSTLYGFKPDPGYVPSAAITRERRTAATQRGLYQKSNARGAIKCCECGKYRAFFSEEAYGKIMMHGDADSKRAHAEIERACDDSLFVCGATLFPPTHDLHSTVFTSPRLECTSPMECTLYQIAHVQASQAAWKRVQSAGFDYHGCACCGVVTVPEEKLVDGQLPRCSECEGARVPIVKVNKTAWAARKEAGEQIRAKKQGAKRKQPDVDEHELSLSATTTGSSASSSVDSDDDVAQEIDVPAPTREGRSTRRGQYC